MTRQGRLRLVYGITLAYFATFGLFLAALQRFVTEELRLGAGTVGVALGAFSVSALLLRPLLGRQMDRRGRRGFLLGALASQVALALAFPFVEGAPLLVAIRLLQGVGHAALYVALTSMVVDLAAPERRASAVSRLSLFLYAGLGVGPPLAEWLVARFGFDVTWLVAAGVLLAALLAASTSSETADGTSAEERVDAAGARALVPAGVLLPGLVVLFPAVGYAAIVGFATLYAEELGMGAAAGLLYAGFAVTVLAVRLVAGSLADRFGNVAAALPGLVATVAGLAVLGFVARPVGAIVGVVLFGAGFALLFPALLTIAVASVPDRRRAEAVAGFTAFTDIGIGAGSYVVGTLIAQLGYAAAFGAAAVGCLVSTALCLPLRARDVRAVSAAAGAARDPGDPGRRAPT